MVGLGAVAGLIGQLFGIGADYLKGKRELRKQKQESEARVIEAVTMAKITAAERTDVNNAIWDQLSVRNAGWKDEWFTLILSVPMIMCFWPGGSVHVKAGFDALSESTPDWYQIAFLLAVASAFGFRKLTEFLTWKKGAK